MTRVPDGKICLNDSGELAVTKFAVEPVWYLPGVAERFGIGMYSCNEEGALMSQYTDDMQMRAPYGDVCSSILAAAIPR